MAAAVVRRVDVEEEDGTRHVEEAVRLAAEEIGRLRRCRVDNRRGEAKCERCALALVLRGDADVAAAADPQLVGA